ncbi:hypothetical protein ABL78_3145 [Leptomonas seymouri]|uniref:Uncharacterized protein n=1 Tax=Leptomonas seymouri TaxID=5684 RepID=A0A0N0P708_LEPSE|nr:hypothetical protein ABL78_3145 [Leptomonas seymouri]|eukprot:KPI87787.1 hypothetical protein ABL78_3145 [Leptomonas seymouri]
MPTHADIPHSGEGLLRTRSVVEGTSVTATLPTFTLPSFVSDEVSYSKIERFSSAIQILRFFRNQRHAGAVVEPAVVSDASAVTTTSIASLTCHHAIAALADVQSMLDFLTSNTATTSEAVRAAVTSAVITALLGGERCNSLLEVLSELAMEVKGKTMNIPSIGAAEMIARALGVLVWVVDAACSSIIEDLVKGDFTATRKCVAEIKWGLWNELAAHDEALLSFARLALGSASSGASHWGAPVHSGVMRTLDALLQTCTALHSYAHCSRAEKAGEAGREGGEQQALLNASRLGQSLTADDMLQRVAEQLQMPVEVLDEFDAFTRKWHTFCYDVLRHGALAKEGDDSGGKGALMKEVVLASVSSTPWTVLDSTRRPQSPLELYTCAVSYLSHATAYRQAVLMAANSKTGSICVAVWKAYVCVLERALQEGEMALISPSSPSPPPALLATVTEGKHAHAPDGYLSPLVMRASCDITIRYPLSEQLPLGESRTNSEPGTPCELPLNAHAGVSGEDASFPLVLPTVVNEVGPLKVTCTVTSNGGSVEFPACPTGAAGIVAPSADCCTSPASTASAALPTDFNATKKHDENNSCSTAQRLARSACRAEGSMRSTAATLAGITDTETTSLCGESAGFLSNARSRPIVIACAKDLAAFTTTANTQGSTGARGSPHRFVRRASTNAAHMLSLSSVCGSPIHSSVALWRGGGAAQGLSVPSPRQQPLCKTVVSSTDSVGLLHCSFAMGPLSLMADGTGRFLQDGSSKSSHLQRELDAKASTAATAAAAFAWPPPVVRITYPSHVLLTKAVLTSLAILTKPSTCAVESMTALVDANVLTVMSELLGYPCTNLQEVASCTLENCFAFWESMMSKSPEKLLPLPVTTPDTLVTAEEQGPVASSFLTEKEAVSALPAPLRGLLHTFTTFLDWSGEGWAALHAQYVQRALRLLVDVLCYAKHASSLTCETATQRVAYCTSKDHSGSASSFLAQEVHYLLRLGVIAHIWRCLSVDATRAPGAVGASSLSPATAGAANRRATDQPPSSLSVRAPTLAFQPASMNGYAYLLCDMPASTSHALLSQSQCTAINLLYTLALSLDWSSATASAAPPTASTNPSVVNSVKAKNDVVPQAATYRCFMEECFKHLPACANCLRRCTYTRSQACPIVPDDHDALSRVLNVLRILFAATHVGIQGAVRDEGTAAAVGLRRNWMKQIVDSQVLDVLAHIGTSKELACFELPHLCIFTLRTYLDHAHVLVYSLLARPASASTSASIRSSALSDTSPRAASAAAGASTTGAARAQAGMAALEVLAADPPSPTITAGASTWDRGTVRESLLVILLRRMQRRCAGHSATSSDPQRLEVLGLIIDVLERIVDSLPTSLTETPSLDSGAAIFDAAEAAELLHLTQRVVSAVIDCRVWSGTAQELRYLDLANMSPVKEALRLLWRVAQLVNGSVRALVSAVPSNKWSDATDSSALVEAADSLEGRVDSALLAESVSVTFAFHIVTMDFPLALAGLVNGTRWQTCGKQLNRQQSGALSSGSSSAGSMGCTTNSSFGSSQRMLRPKTAVVVTMKALPPSLVPRRMQEMNEFGDEDRREMCEVSASTLLELLCSLRRVVALLSGSALLSHAVLGSLFHRSHNSRRGSARTGAAGCARTLPTTTASISPTRSALDRMHLEPSQSLDVVVVQSPAADFPGMVTSLLYPHAIAASLEPLPAQSENPSVMNAVSSDEQRAPDSTRPLNSNTLPDAEPETDDPLNWRRTAQRWRRRVPLLRTTLTEALHALDLNIFDSYLAFRRRHQQHFDYANAGAFTSHDDALTPAEAAMAILAAEKKRYLESS